MASYLPPTEDLPIFDTQVFDTANNAYLTYADAKKYFVTYPIAQGTATISDLIAGGISYLTPASGSFFNIGTNQVSGGTIRIGPTGGSAGVSVHCGNIDFKNNTINNATAPTTSDISICDVQTRGTLNIGTGNRSRTTATTEGTINIGTGLNTNTLGAIPQINIGSNTGLSNVTGINIGGTATTTTLSGASNTITSGGLIFRTANNVTGETTNGTYAIFNNLISTGTLAIGGAGTTTIGPLTLTQPLILPAVHPTLNTQLGFSGQVFTGLVGFTAATLTDIVSVQSASLPIGVYLLTYTLVFDTWAPVTGNCVFSSNVVNATLLSFPTVTKAFGNSLGTTISFTVLLKVTAAGGYTLLRGTTSAATTVNIQSNAGNVTYVRIA
jgi:hypothetical protein